MKTGGRSMTGIPLYIQVQQHIAARIDQGEFRLDMPIPTEEQLCEQYNVSRITLRRAIEQLVATDRLYRKRGVGTFVTPAKSGKFVRLVGQLHDVLTFEQRLNYRVLKRGPLAAPKAVAKTLEIEEGAQAYAIEAEARIDEATYAHTHFFLPMAYADVAEQIPMTDEPPIRSFERLSGLRAAGGEQSIEAALVDARLAKVLKLDPGTPVIRTLRTYLAVDGKPLETVVVHYHPDRYKYHIDLIGVSGNTVRRHGT